MLLYHYCSNDTFLKIIGNSELWLSELTLSNDSMEGAWVQKVLLEECRERNLPPHVLDDFAEKTRSLLDIFSAAGFCLSAKGDLLSQWRGYADNGAGVAIGFDHESLIVLCNNTEENIDIDLLEITYDPKNQRAAIRPYADKLEELVKIDGLESKIKLKTPIDVYIKNAFSGGTSADFLYSFHFVMMTKILFKLKNQAFSEEKEWRILSLMSNETIIDNPLNDTPYSNAQNLSFRARGDHIVPYLRLPIPNDKKGCIKEIILGPRNRTPEPVIRAALEKYGFQNVDIRRSAATYR